MDLQALNPAAGFFTPDEPASSYKPEPVRYAASGLPYPQSKPDRERMDFYRVSNPTQCVPYARNRSGIQIRGNANTWWHQAAHHPRYTRGQTPKAGSVIVLSKTNRLRYGHIGVVERVIDSRTIEVAHANWGGDRYTRSYVYNRMPAIDISKNNDWSKVRFWDYPSRSYGSVYPAYGFVYH